MKCPNCQKELNRHNSRRKLIPGTSKARLVCRAFPDCSPPNTKKVAVKANSRKLPRFSRGVQNALAASKRKSFPAEANLPATLYLETAREGPQEGPGRPITVEGVLDYPPPTRVKFFVRQATAEKIRKALDLGTLAPSITVEVLRVKEALAEMNPEAFADLVPVEINLGGVK
jgi:hypothetical protein